MEVVQFAKTEADSVSRLRFRGADKVGVGRCRDIDSTQAKTLRDGVVERSRQGEIVSLPESVAASFRASGLVSLRVPEFGDELVSVLHLLVDLVLWSLSIL